MKQIIMFLYVKLGFGKLNAQEKVSKALSIAAALTGNTNFPVTDPPHADITAAANALQDAINDAESGNHEMVAVKDDKEAILDKLMRRLQSDINTKSDGDPVKILSAGMDPAAPRTPVGLLGPVNGLTAVTSLIPMRIDLKWPRVDKTRVYVVQRCTSLMPGNWELIGETTKASFTDNEADSGVIYFYRIACITAAGLGPWCDAVSAKAL